MVFRIKNKTTELLRRKKISETFKLKKINRDEGSYQWKGDKASYSSKHKYISRNWIKPEICDFCKKIKKLDWANISKDYRRVRSDWLCLCRKCHFNFDDKTEKRDAYGRFVKTVKNQRFYRPKAQVKS